MTNWWQAKRVSLLGGASLIGSHLAEALIKADVSQLIIADDLSAGRIKNLEGVINEGAKFKQMDLRNYENALKAVDKSDVVFHLAAQHGGRGYVASHKTELYDNLSLDATIFRACAERSVGKVVFSSSACAYPIDLQTNPDEELRLSEDMIDYSNIRQPDGPYGEEKLMGEKMLDAYIERGCFAGCSTRSFTVYGPRMTETHAIAALIAKVMLRQHPLEVWGDGQQVRNWTYVEDNVAGAMLAAEHLERGAINIGVEDRLTPLKALFFIGEYMGWHPEDILFMKDKPVGPLNRVADATKLKYLGWTPKYSFREGLEKTIDWYLSTHDADELRESLERKLTER